MKFIIIRKADRDTEASVMPSDQLLQDMGRYNESLINAGVMVDGQGLKASEHGFRVNFVEGKPIVTDGPFTEIKELVAGFTIIDVATKEEAIEWVRGWPPLDGNGEVALEVRQLFEMEDFSEGDGIELHRELADRGKKMPASAGPYLMFNGNCREAFEYYADCLGGNIKAMLSFKEMPDQSEVNPDMADYIMHACLQIGKLEIMGSDDPNDYQVPQGFHVQLTFNEPEKAEDAFAQLAGGGNITMPMSETFWAERFGMLVDRFGIPWMVNCECENSSLD